MVALLSILVAGSLHCLARSLSLGRLFESQDLQRAATSNECNLDGLPFYVLNLDRRDEKLSAMEGVIERDAPWMCKQTCRVSAPDGRLWGLLTLDLKSRIIDERLWHVSRSTRQYERIAGGKLTPGAVALMAGHGQIWEHILQEKAAFAVVMEDDLSRFHPDTKAFICNITQTQSLQDGWDFMIMQMGHSSVDASKSPTLKRNEHVYNTGMYIIKLDAARKALQATFPIVKPFQMDSPMSAFWTKLKGAHTIPALADASHEFTDVQQYLLNNVSASVSSRCSIDDCKPLDTSRMVIPELANPVKE